MLYGGEDAEKYTTTRDIISYGITKENEAGRATENGGVHLSFQHISEEDLREAAVGNGHKNMLGVLQKAMGLTPLITRQLVKGAFNMRKELVERAVQDLAAQGEDYDVNGLRTALTKMQKSDDIPGTQGTRHIFERLYLCLLTSVLSIRVCLMSPFPCPTGHHDVYGKNSAPINLYVGVFNDMYHVLGAPSRPMSASQHSAAQAKAAAKASGSVPSKVR